MRLSSFSSAHSVIQNIAQTHGMEVRLWEYRLQTNWASVVGHPIAHSTRPDRLRFRKLSITVENSVWLQQLTFLKPSLLKKIQGHMNNELVADIIFRVGVISQPPENTSLPPSHSSQIVQPTPDAQQKASLATVKVTNLTLRDSLSTLVAKALSSP